MIKYLGSKRTLLPQICDLILARGARSAVDLFSGTARVGHALKARGLTVHANDHNAYAATLARCYVQADADRVAAEAAALIAELNALPGEPGWFTHTFCERSRFFQPHNGARVDAVRSRIAALALPPELEAVLLVSLMEAADRVDSTTGIQMAYLKRWAPRSARPLELRLPALLPGSGCTAHQRDALEAAGSLEADVLYLDPPYNAHKYLNNYHIWESLVRWDMPEVYGVACKRVDCRTRRSPFNHRRTARDALAAVVARARARWIVASFSDEGFLSREDMEQILSAHGPVQTVAHDFPRYVGARIGIYSPAGEKVGAVSHTRNTEYLFVAGQ